MPAKVSKLLAQLKRSYPELEKEPLLDDIEMAAYEDEDAEELGSEVMEEELDLEAIDMEDDEADLDIEDEDALMLDLEAEEDLDEELPPPPPKKLKKPIR